MIENCQELATLIAQWYGAGNRINPDRGFGRRAPAAGAWLCLFYRTHRNWALSWVWIAAVLVVAVAPFGL